MLYLISAVVFLSAALLTVAILYPLLTKKSVVRGRLEKMMPAEREMPILAEKKNFLQDTLDRLGKTLPMRPAELSKYGQLLIAAGYGKSKAPVFIGVKLLLTIVLPAVYFLYLSFFHRQVFSRENLLIMVILAICGFLLPSYWLERKVKNRQTEIFHSLPDVLDLLTVCVEAGLGIDAALIKVSEDPQFADSPIAIELRQTSKEIRLGRRRTEALRDMGERTMVEDIKAFAVMLIQTERFGTSLGLSLRVHSDSLRTIRRQRAEEVAAKTAVKMLFPLAFLIFPALLVAILGSAMIKLNEFFK